MAFKLVFISLATAIAASNAIIIDCSYSMIDYSSVGYGTGPVYECGAQVNTLDNIEAITAVIDTGATADPALTTADVKWFSLYNGFSLSVYQLPSNMAAIFPNLIGLQWTSSRLRTIKPSDLAPYPNLVVLGLGMNAIQKLDGNLFQNNHKLLWIDLAYNAIQEIGPGLMNGLNSLNKLYIFGNICTGTGSQIDGILHPPNTLADVQRALDFLCGPSTPSEELGACNPCLANCTARAAALQIRANAVTESVYAPWYYKMRAFLKAVSLW